jgi:hypothetical protein
LFLKDVAEQTQLKETFQWDVMDTFGVFKIGLAMAKSNSFGSDLGMWFT